MSRADPPLAAEGRQDELRAAAREATLVAAIRLGTEPRSTATLPSERSVLLGQVLTPPGLALLMAERLLDSRRTASAAILDPAVGPGTFPAALSRSMLLTGNDLIYAFDLDPGMVAAARTQCADLANLKVSQGDYLELESDVSYDYAILNPPWVRQEWITKKANYLDRFRRLYGASVPGTSNLYVYFLVKVISELAVGGKFVALVYDSWLSTRYGRWLMRFIDEQCEDVSWERLGGQPFKGRLIDATLLTGIRRRFPSTLAPIAHTSDPLPAAHVRMDDLVSTRRGLRLKQANFFLCKVPLHGATPFVKKVGGIRGFAVPMDHEEWALLATPHALEPAVIQQLESRLKEAQRAPDRNKSVLTWYRERPQSWFLHREPPTAPILFNYYLRGKPRHLLNANERPYSDNFYGITPRAGYPITAALAALNSSLFSRLILAAARSQGAGLSKIQLYEYRQMPVPDWRAWPREVTRDLTNLGTAIATEPTPHLFDEIDRVVEAGVGASRLTEA